MAKKKAKVEQKKEKGFASFYKKNYKKFLILPILLFLFSLTMIFVTVQKDGTPIYRDVSLKGGLSAIVEINSELGAVQLENNLKASFTDNTFVISELYENNQISGFIIDTDLDDKVLFKKLNEIFGGELEDGVNYNSNFISPTLSNMFFKQAIYKGLLPAFILMSIVVFLYFRETVPSLAVVLSAIFDIVVTIGILDLMGFRVSVAGIGALIMLIGYSIDTDILLTNRLIKERGDNYFAKTFDAFKTGTLMSITTLIAGIGAIILTNSSVIAEIAIILVIGLIVDYISTWVQNTAVLLWWIEKKNI